MGISKAFGWPILSSSVDAEVLDIIDNLGCTSIIAQTFVTWMRSWRMPDSSTYKYESAPEVADFLQSFAREGENVLDNRCGTWREFRDEYLSRWFDSWPPTFKQAAANTYHEWKFGLGGRRRSPKYVKPAARPSAPKVPRMAVAM